MPQNLSSLHVLYSVVIQDLRDIACHLKKVYNGSLSCNWLAFAAFSFQSVLQAQKKGKLGEIVGKGKAEEELEGEVVEWNSGNTLLFWGFLTSNYLFNHIPLLWSEFSGMSCIQMSQSQMRKRKLGRWWRKNMNWGWFIPGCRWEVSSDDRRGGTEVVAWGIPLCLAFLSLFTYIYFLWSCIQVWSLW